MVEERHDPPPDAASRRGRLAGHAAALAVFVFAALLLSWDVWQRGPREYVQTNSVAATGEELDGFWRELTTADTTFVAWLVARNAHTLIRRPWRLFDAEHCAPTPRSLALSEPVITLGILGIPASILGGDPILTYNSALLLLRVVMALAMYALVICWTRSTGAAIAAGLLYAFHPIWTRDVTHAFIYDTSWTLLALLFAQRLCARGRWRDAVLLGACIVLQMGTSLYPMLAALCVALPFSVWLLRRYGLRHLRPGRVGAVLAIAALGAMAVYGPFLALRSSADTLRAGIQIEAVWSSFLPGGLRFQGWLVLALAAAAFLPRQASSPPGQGVNPRWALLAGGLLVALVATGPSQPSLGPVRVPNLYGLLAAVLPGLDSVRAVGRISVGVHLAACVLAGLGAAALLARAPERVRAAAAALLVVVAALLCLRPSLVGLEKRPGYLSVAVRPSEQTLAFFADIAAKGSEGALVELPLSGTGRIRQKQEAMRIVASAWHGRRTTACYGSFLPPGRDAFEAVVATLPEPDAVRALHDLGFRTVVVWAPAREVRIRLNAAARREGSGIRLLEERGVLSAWSLEPGVP